MKAVFTFAIIMLAAGCAEPAGKYPSLALRPIESRSEVIATPPAPVAQPDAALDAQIASQATKLAQIDRDFSTTAARADAAAKARGALAEGSDQWVAAQSALAELDGLHGDTLGLVGDLERIVTDRGVAGAPPYPALDALLATAQAQVDSETARIASVKALRGEK